MLDLIRKIFKARRGAEQLKATNQELLRQINERNQAEQRLRLQEVILRNMSEGVCLVRERDRTIVYVNPKFERMFGYDAGELIGKPANILNAMTDETKAQEATLSILRRVAGAGEATYEVHNVKKDGAPFWCRAHISKFDHPEHGLGWVAVHEDISERKQAEYALQKAQAELERRVQLRTAELEKANEALQAEIARHAKVEKNLQASEERLQLALDIAQMSTWDWELSTNDVNWAGHNCKLAGFPLTLTEASEDSRACIVHEADRLQISETLSHAREFGAPFNEEFRIVRPEGTMNWVIAQGRGFLDETGKVTRLIGVVQDITERKKYEEQLTASLKEKEVLLKEIHHRVKNNLQILSSLLKLQSKSAQDQHTRELFEESQARVKTMALIHEELYRTSNLTKIEFVTYVQHLANNLVRMYVAQSKDVKLDINVDDIQLDVDRAIPCGLIINELVSNSLKYAFPAELLARRGRGENEIDIELRVQDDEHVALRIRDNGVGLPADLDIHHTTTLGMQLVHTLTEQLSGTIEYHNHHGAEFAITFSSRTSNKRI